MKMHGNTILITGGASGIGLALANEFAKLDNKVIIAGRSEAKLQSATKDNPQLCSFALDVGDMKALPQQVAKLLAAHPDLNAVIHCAGVMKNENFKKIETMKSVSEETVMTNILGTIRLNELILAKFVQAPHATIMTVTSGLGYMPLVMTPTYSASKAAIHSYTESLRYQMQGTQIEVLELVPPYVATSLMGDRQAADPNAMPLDAFVAEVMQILKSGKELKEITVERVKPQRLASAQGPEHYDKFFKQFNDTMMNIRKAEF